MIWKWITNNAGDLWFLFLIAAIATLSYVVRLIERAKNIPVGIKEREAISQRESEVEQGANELKALREGVEILAREKALGFPWLATAYSEYFELFDIQTSEELKRKKHPALRAADEVRRIGREKALLRKENKILRELHRYYEGLFPWLIDFKGTDLDEVIKQLQVPLERNDDSTEDPALTWMTDAEISSDSLTRAEKFQRALDRYWKNRKTPWQIGRDYERYIGYLHEKDGLGLNISERLLALRI